MIIPFLVIIGEEAVEIIGSEHADIDEIVAQAIEHYLVDKAVEDVNWKPYIGFVPKDLSTPELIEEYMLLIPTTLVLSNIGYHSYASRLNEQLL